MTLLMSALEKRRQTAASRHGQEPRRSESVILASSMPVSSHLCAHPQQSGQKMTVTALKKPVQTADKLLPEIHSSVNKQKKSRQAEIWLDVTSEGCHTLVLLLLMFLYSCLFCMVLSEKVTHYT